VVEYLVNNLLHFT